MEKEFDSRSLEEMGIRQESDRQRLDLNHTYHGPEMETKQKKCEEIGHTYHGHEREMKQQRCVNGKYTYHDEDTYYRPGEETKLKGFVQSEEDLKKKFQIDRKVEKSDEIGTRTDTEKYRKKDNEQKFMSWIDEKYDALSRHGSNYERDDNIESESSEEKTEEEDSDDEMRQIQRGIELLKSKEATIKGKVREKAVEKKQREEEKKALEEERKKSCWKSKKG